MSKRVFKYNHKDFDLKYIFDEYVKFNMKIATEINKKCSKTDWVIVNDSSLLLLPDMVKCKFSTFIERVPFYKKIITVFLNHINSLEVKLVLIHLRNI